MANNQNPTMGAPMGAGRALGLSNQFFQGPGNPLAPQGQVWRGPPPGQAPIAQPTGQISPAGMQGLQNWASQLGAQPKDPNAPQTPASSTPLFQGQLQGARPTGPMPSMTAAPPAPGQQSPLGAPGQGAGGGKGGAGQGMTPQMQQQIARLPGGPGAGAPRRLQPGAPGAGPGGQKAPGMQRQIAQLPGAPR